MTHKFYNKTSNNKKEKPDSPKLKLYYVGCMNLILVLLMLISMPIAKDQHTGAKLADFSTDTFLNAAAANSFNNICS
jgi:hypothetical protein